ncbi:efflux RND transporter periplasmic adaptor subunit [Mangrovimicrobium sediminis]|uniref:Efflux RND transporter periplasmic adaptor subunit n=1 Tax=Mangrovimicrobium sediminis TaxID=2562682 RepID=A0A4Z0M851_9GAMM|nr:efflux RND transporter periplasmic adaptor subunit [Haliea sp. SAOS-164]TGD75485.1 efflux RND transporter periplasmic adaptor subunit [Haliea sp. SAOS-164]
MPKLVKNVLAPLVLLGLAVLVAIAMVKSREELPRREREASLPVVETAVAQPGPVPVTVHSRGSVTPRWTTELVSEVAGRVIWVAEEFRQGAQVRAGQPLLRIDPIDYEVAVSTAEAALASAELSLAEVSVVKKEAAMEEARAQVKAAEARLRQARVDLENTTISAPFDAVVDAKHADLGQYVWAGVTVMKLLGIEMAEVRLPVLASDVSFLHYGADADGSWHTATLSADFGAEKAQWTARLARLEQRVDTQTRVYFLVAEVDEPYKAGDTRPLTMGLFVEAQFSGSDIPDAVRLPRSALHAESYVYVLRDGRIHRQPVTLLRREQDTVILGGLAEGQRVVLSRLDLMVDGMPVLEAGAS